MREQEGLTRTTADRRRKPNREQIIREATVLRERGLTWKEIAPHVGASPPWLTMYMPNSLQHWTNGELADRREAHETDVPLAELREKRRRLSRMKYIARNEPPRVIELVCEAQSVDALVEARAQYGRERQRARKRRLGSLLAAMPPLRLDAPLPGFDGDLTMGSSVARPLDDTDPQTYMETELLDSIVGNLSIDDIQRLDERSLARLQAKLLAAGFRPGGVQEKERERLRQPERHRGYAPAPTSGKKSSRHRGRNAQSALMAGKRTSRKQPKRWSRA